MVVLDTHAVVWWAGDPGRLSTTAAAIIDKTERLGLPAIVFWETALLVRKGRLEPDAMVNGGSNDEAIRPNAGVLGDMATRTQLRPQARHGYEEIGALLPAARLKKEMIA